MAKKVSISLKRKRELFAKEYALTRNGPKSYMKIYDCSKKSADSCASKMLKRKDVQEMIEIEEKALEDVFKDKRVYVAENLIELIDKAKLDDDRNTQLKALDIINKMTGAYVHKQEMDVTTTGFVFNFIEPEDNTQDVEHIEIKNEDDE